MSSKKFHPAKENAPRLVLPSFWSARSVDGARMTRSLLSLVNFSNSYFEKVPGMLCFPTDPLAGGGNRTLWLKMTLRSTLIV